MTQANFSEYLYYPEISPTWSEKIAFSNLKDEDKNRVLLTYLLGQVDNSSANLEPAISGMLECAQERPFVVDLLKHPAPNPYEPKSGLGEPKARERYDREAAIKESYDATLNTLLDPTNGFAAWRRLVDRWDNAIPVLQFTKPQQQARSILRQAAKFVADERHIAVRLNRTDANDLIPIISNIFALIDRPSHMLFILDMGQARSQLAERESFIINTMSQIMSLVGERDRSELRFVCTGGSFTNGTREGLDSRDIHERQIWDNLAESGNIRYGDYGSMLRRISDTTYIPSEWKAAVALPTRTSWWCWRSTDSRNAGEWEVGAKVIAGGEDFHRTPECWGKSLIQRGVDGDTADIQSSKHWIAARINIHLKQQIDYSEDIENLSDVI